MGWSTAPLGEIADTTLGKMLDKSKSTGKHPVPYMRNINIQWGHIDLDNVFTMDISPSEQEFFALQEGDLLVCEGGEIGRCAIWHYNSGYTAFQKALHRVRPTEAATTYYLRYYFEYLARTGKLARFATGSTIKHLPQQRLREIPIVLPPPAEQTRIVETLEDHFSHLDTAIRELKSARKKIFALRKSTLLRLVPEVPPRTWSVITTGEAGIVELGRQRHPDWHHGPEMHPYLRVANVFEDRIDTSDVMEMDFSGVFEKYRLEPGDILLNEGQSPHLVGRPAIYRGNPPNVAYTNSILRFRPHPNVLSEWALIVFRRHMHARRFMREVRITTNIAHLSKKRLENVEFPVPSIEEQKRLVQSCDEIMSNADAMEHTIERNLAYAENLRTSLLNRAFSGSLVPQNAADTPASVYLDSTCAKRYGEFGERRGGIRRSRKASAVIDTPSPPTTSPALAKAVQQELSL